MCKKLPSDAVDFVIEAVPLFTNLLQYHDVKVLERASVCLTRIAEAFVSYPDKLDELCNHGLVTQAATLISISNSGGGQASLSTPTYTGLMRLISACASGSPLCAKTLLHLGISGSLKDILLGSGISANSSVPPALSRPAEQIFEIVNLANELLPPLPQGTISFPSSYYMFVKGPVVCKSPASSSGKQDYANGNASEVSAWEKLLRDQPELLLQFGVDLLPVLIQIYGSSVFSPVRYKCLSVIGKLMYFSSAEMIQSLLSVTNISRCYRQHSGNANPEVNSSEEPNNPVSVNVGLPPSSVANPTVISNFRTAVSACAKAFKEKYFLSDPGAAEVGVIDHLLHIKNLCMTLNAGVDGQRTKEKGKSKASGSRLADISAAKEEYLIEVRYICC